MADETRSRLGFTDLLLIGVVLLTLTVFGAAGALYVFSPNRIEIPELLPSVRVADEADFPAGASRLVRWGERIILVVRSPDEGFFAVQGIGTGDGCILEWDPESLRIVSPCSYLVYDLRGRAVRGLATAPLARYSVFVRRGVVYVAGNST